MNGREVSLDEFLIDGADVRLERGAPCRTVADAIQRLGLAAWLSGGAMRILLNGKTASLEDRLSEGDALELSLSEASAKP
jgi:hypothetical protein